MIDTQFSQVCKGLDGRSWGKGSPTTVAREPELVAVGRLLNVFIRAFHCLTVFTKHSQFPLQLVFPHAREEVTGIRIAGDQSQRLALPASSNQDRGMRFLHRLRSI